MDENKSSIDITIENTGQTETETPKPTEKPKKVRSFQAKWIFLVVVLMLLSAGVTYYWQNSQFKNKLKAKNLEIAAQQKKINDQQKEIDELEAAASGQEDTASDSPATVPSTALKENIEAAMNSNNYAALEQNMADSVYVVIAASEFAQNRTPVQAVNDLKYFDSATDPWNFALPAATLSAYASSDYATYFPSSAYVGKAASGQIVSYQFDSSGKIKTIFMSAADIL